MDAMPEEWKVVRNGLRKRVAPRGPWFQFADSSGFEWNTYQISLHHLHPDLVGFRIVQLADIHARHYWQPGYDSLIQRLADDPPDLLLLSGDMVEDMFNPAPAIPIARRLVNQLTAKLGIYAVRGNHDISVPPNSFIGTKVQYIDGQQILIQPNPNTEARLEILGIPGPLRKHLTQKVISDFPEKDPATPRLILSHFPDHIRKLQSLNPDLYLAGHTHGGQVCLPLGIPIIRHDSLPLRLSKGIHRLGHTWFIVSKGFGFSSAPVRLFCPAEVIELRLTPG